ncbi:hypothetical protein ABGB12_20915 [Actinocorallia sp. B10E7]|uniref:hypothetical protein n=1 Tax=Actinocorallia sp. B10E7 TaxID=3153558 RepID=UPI00325F1571
MRHRHPVRHGRKAVIGLLLVSAALTGWTQTGTVPDLTRTAAPSSPAPLEPIEVESTVAMPPGVTLNSGQANSLKLIAGEKWVIANVTYRGTAQVAAIELGGPGFSCISCGALDGAREASPFPDGKRALMAGAAAGASDIQHQVVECTPSLQDCREREVLPIVLPRDGLLQGAQNREPRLHPDGKHLTWTEVRMTEGPVMLLAGLERRAKRYVVTSPRVLNPAYRLGSDPTGWEEGGRYYETGGGWLDGGRTLVYRATGSALNYDIWELDLATGHRRKITEDLDYNEMYEGSPDGRTSAYASARGLDRMDVVTRLRRPTFLDTTAFAQIGRAALWNNRRCMNERWLMDREGQRGTYGGQPVVLQDGWVMRGWDWFHDSTRAVITEEPFTPTAGGTGAADVRMRIIRFPARRPTAPRPVVDLDTVDYARWSVPYKDYRGIASRQVRGRKVEGRRSGTATLDFTGTFAAGKWKVRYDRYSDDGRTFLTGTESLATPSPTLLGVWQADLKATGRHPGHLRGRLTITKPAKVKGTVESEVDGVRSSGLPAQADCPGVRQPQLALTAAGTGPGKTVRVRVTARVPEDPTPRPVRDAQVTASGTTVRTDADGYARVPANSGNVTAVAGGFKPASLALP